MSDEGVERKLTTILAADVVGYSRLMGEDEAGTLAALKAHRQELMDPKTAQYHGRTIKLMGDGTLMEFTSVVDAVAFSVEVQSAMRERNAEIPEDRRIVYRIGINIGDIIVEGDDIFGDGVNVAARLEGLAEPGGICVRRNVRNQIRDKLDLSFEDLGEIEVKNIARPVRAFRVVLDDKATALATPVVKDAVKSGVRHWPVTAAAIVLLLSLAGGTLWWRPWAPELQPTSIEQMAFPLPDKPSIAVLPFANISGDHEQEYFADGMTDDLITDLSKVSGLFVIARNSSFAFKGKPIEIRKVAEDLAVRYVLEGSIRRSNNKVRVNAQLIDATSGRHLWAERYDRDYTDVFAVQDEIVGKIVAALEVTLTAKEETQLTKLPTENLEAYENYLRAEEHYYSRDTSRLPKSLIAYEEAIALDDKFAGAHAGYARAAVDVWRFNFIHIMPGPLARNTAEVAANRALELDPDIPTAHSVLALIRMIEGEHALSIEAARRAVYNAPSNSDAYLYLAVALGYAGEHAEALEAIKTARGLNPITPPYLESYFGWSLFMNRQYERAIEVLEPARRKAGGASAFGDSSGEVLAMAYAMLDRQKEARAEIDRLIEQEPFASLTYYGLLYRHHKNDKDLEFRLDALRRAGLPEWMLGYQGIPKNQLDGAALEEITTARTWIGWDSARDDSFIQEFGADGTTVYSGGSALMTGRFHVQSDTLCIQFELMIMGRDQCGYVYRNPEGTPEDANEFTHVRPGHLLRFSIER